MCIEGFALVARQALNEFLWVANAAVTTGGEGVHGHPKAAGAGGQRVQHPSLPDPPPRDSGAQDHEFLPVLRVRPDPLEGSTPR
jgi:hypothetical protein